MIILFKGTDKSKNNSPQALALTAGILATKFYKKTLVLQLTLNYPVENYLIGKRLNDENIDDKSYLFEDSGIDSLIRRVGVASFRKEHFANAVTPAVDTDNLLDILNVSKKTEEDLLRELENNPTIVGTILKAAVKIYDNVLVLASGKHHKLISGILPYIDKTVTCIPQSVKEEIIADSTENSCYLITNYDYKSSYGVRQMEKIYGGKMFTMPYNVDFKDYYTNNNMLQYILHNISPQPEDYSYHLIGEMTKFVGYLIDEEEYEDRTFKFSIKTLDRILDEQYTLNGSDVKIDETPGGFFKKAKKEVHVRNRHNLSIETEDDAEDYFDEDLHVQEIEPKKEKKRRIKRKLGKNKGSLKETDRIIEDEEPIQDEYPDEEPLEYVEKPKKKKKLFQKLKNEEIRKKSVKEQIDEFVGDRGDDEDDEEEFTEDEIYDIKPEPAPKPVKKPNPKAKMERPVNQQPQIKPKKPARPKDRTAYEEPIRPMKQKKPVKPTEIQKVRDIQDVPKMQQSPRTRFTQVKTNNDARRKHPRMQDELPDPNEPGFYFDEDEFDSDFAGYKQ